MHAPKQDRSKATLSRLMEAAETLMAEQPFEKITLQQIVAEAKTTTGSFYARFSDKNSMLAALFEEHIQSINELITTTLLELPTLSPRKRIDRIVKVVGESFRLRPALMRSGTLLFWNRAKGDEQLREPMAPRSELLRQLGQAIEATAAELGSSNPEVSARLALKIMLSATRQHYLFSDETTILVVQDEQFQKELSDMVYAYISFDENAGKLK